MGNQIVEASHCNRGDNSVRGGSVIDSDSDDPDVKGLRDFIQIISADERLEATAIQTVGEKGWDGFVRAVSRQAFLKSGSLDRICGLSRT